jgi:hypothetical protein
VTVIDVADLGAFDLTHYSYTELATSSSTTLTFGFRQDPSWLGLDDVSVARATGVPDSTFTASLLGLGLLGLVALRRKLS